MPSPSEIITSRENPRLRQVRRTAKGAGGDSGTALAESPHLLREALRSGIEIERVLASETARKSVAACMPPHRRIPVHVVADRLFDSIATTTRHQGVLALVKLPRWKADEVFQGLTVALDGVQDPGNAGSVLRSAEAFGASGVAFLAGSAVPTNPKVLRAAAGSLFRLPFVTGLDPQQLLDACRARGKALYAADAHGGVPLPEADLAPGAAVIIGSETHGVSPLLAEEAAPIAIPTHSVESLNAAAAAAVILYEFARRTSRR